MTGRFCDMVNNFHIVGAGTTKEKAALEFMDSFYKNFPKDKGYYDMTIRVPLTYDQDADGNCMYRLRGYWNKVADLTPPPETELHAG